MTWILKKITKFTAGLMIVLFGFNMLYTPVSMAQVSFLPRAGMMVAMTGKYNPVVIKGMQLYPNNPFKFDFIVDTGDSHLSQDELKDESHKLIAYFLASLTTPEKEMWVNLSPYEKDRIIPKIFGETEMGKELLAQDYLLKQIMATALYPERELGHAFWQKVYTQAKMKFGTTDVPVNTFNKVWILPDKAEVYENSQTNSVFVVQSTLKVMLEQDYLAMKKNSSFRDSSAEFTPESFNRGPQNDVTTLGSQIIRQIVIPALEKEVNEGKNFAPLRQVYQSLILAAWYKKNLKDNVIAQAYVDRNKIKGVDVADKNITAKIYKQYLRAYRRGVYNYIKEEIDPATQSVIPRKYFSGGVVFNVARAMVTTTDKTQAAALFQPNMPDIYRVQAGADGEIAGAEVVLHAGVGQSQAMPNTVNANQVVPGSAADLGIQAVWNALGLGYNGSDFEDQDIALLTPPPTPGLAEAADNVNRLANELAQLAAASVSGPAVPAEVSSSGDQMLVPAKSTASNLEAQLARARNSVEKAENDYDNVAQALAAAKKNPAAASKYRQLLEREQTVLNVWLNNMERYETIAATQQSNKIVDEGIDEIVRSILRDLFGGDLSSPKVVANVRTEIVHLAPAAIGNTIKIMPERQLADIINKSSRNALYFEFPAQMARTPLTVSEKIKQSAKRLALVVFVGVMANVAWASTVDNHSAPVAPAVPVTTIASAVSVNHVLDWPTVQYQLAHVGLNGAHTPTEALLLMKRYINDNGEFQNDFSRVHSGADLALPLSAHAKDKVFSILQKFQGAQKPAAAVPVESIATPIIKHAERILSGPAEILHDLVRAPALIAEGIAGKTIPAPPAVKPLATPPTPKAEGVYPVVPGEGIFQAIEAAGFSPTQAIGWITHYQVIIIPAQGNPYTYINHRSTFHPDAHFKIVAQSTGQISKAVAHAVTSPMWHAHQATHPVKVKAKSVNPMPNKGHWERQSGGRGGSAAVWVQDKAMAAKNGGIDLAQVDVNSSGGGVRTAFSNPQQLKMLLNADGLVPVIYHIQPMTAPMMNMLLGFNASTAAQA